MAQLFSNVGNLTWQQAVMWLIGGILIYLAVKRDMEPALLLPMGFGAILVNLPLSGAVTQIVDGVEEIGVLNVLFDAGIANELFPLLLFVGIGAMIDFEPLLNDPKLMFFGAAAQFGIFFTFSLAALLGFPIKDAAAIGIIGAADGPTAIFMANFLRSNYLGAIMVAAYSYMALVPIVQPPVIRALTTTHERRIRMPYHQHTVSRRTKILFPIIITAVCGITEPVLFGVTMKIRTNMIAAMAGGGVGGFFMGLMNTKNYSGGSPGLLTLPSYIGLDAPMSNFYYACAGAAIAFVVAFIVSFVLFRDEKKN